MGTFSINIGLITESSSYPLHIQNYFDDILLTLKDNEDKLINPVDVRNSILSLWTSIPFKETITNVEYIGLDDTLNPNNVRTTKTIFLGKRSFSGTQSYLPSHDIMNSTLLNSDVDIFLFNTKSDTISNTLTRVSVLAGNNFNLHPVSPFIQSSLVTGATPSLSLDFVSVVGDTNFKSEQYSSTFSVNMIPFPTIDRNYASASDSKTLIWRGSTSSGYLSWEEITLPNTNTIGTTGSELNIYGNPVLVNGYSLEMDDSRYTPISVGGIPMGTTFSNYPIVEVLRRIIYPYLGPQCTITTEFNFYETGTIPTITLNYSITKRSENTQIANLINMIPASVNAINSANHETISGTAIGIIPNGGIIDSIPNYFIVTVSDGGTYSNSNASASTIVQGILPYYYGITISNIINGTGLLSLQKLVEVQGDKELYLQGMGNMYFIYDNFYPALTEIIDENENDVFGDFTMSVMTFTSPQSYWLNRQFKVYKRILSIPVGPPNAKYSFRY